MGQRCLNLGNPKEALACFEQILQAEPDNTKTLVKKGNILGKLGKYEASITMYDMALEHEPENILAHINKGLALHYLGRYDDAVSCYDNALKLKPKSTVTLYNKASSLVKQNNIKEGLQILRQVISLDYSYKTKAKYDIDFKELKTNSDFQRIIL